MKKKLTAMVLAACFAAAPLTACGDDSERDVRKLTKEIGELQEKCDDLESELSDVRSDIDDVSGAVDDCSTSFEEVKELYSSLYDYVGDMAESLTKEPPKEETTVDRRGGSDDDYTDLGGTIVDSDNKTVALPMVHGDSDDSLADFSPVEDEEIAPESSKVPDDYKPEQASDYAMWLDISEKKDFIFNGETVLVTMKIKKDAPDGVYPVAIRTDLSNVEGNQIIADKEISGSICINSTAEPFDADSTDDFVFYGDSVSCKPGDTVEFNINIANNPGLAAFVIYMYYDSNAIEIEDMTAAGEFKKINDKW